MIRTARGRWSVLSPVYPWPVQTEYKKYPSLLNYLVDDDTIQPSALLTRKLAIKTERIITGLQYLLRTWPRFKLFLAEAPDNIEFVNPSSPTFAKEYTALLRQAKQVVKKYRVKGQEVVENAGKFETIGATIVGDEAIFDYDAKEQVVKAVYGLKSEEMLSKLVIIGKMISSFIYLFDKIPDFLTFGDENPSVYHALVKSHTPQVSRMLCAVNVEQFKPLDLSALKHLLFRINEHIGSLWPYIVFPNELHSSIKKTDGMVELENKIRYHIEYATPFKTHIIVCLEMLDYSFAPKGAELLSTLTNVADGTDSEDLSGSIEKLIIDMPLDGEEGEPVQIDEDLIDRWAIKGEEDEFVIVKEKVVPVEEKKDVPVEEKKQTVPVETVPTAAPSTLAQELKSDGAAALSTAIVGTAPVVSAPVQPAPTIAAQLPSADWDKRFNRVSSPGHIVEPTNPLSPFGKNQITWKGIKYENMLSVLYNEAILACIGAGEQTFKGSANKAKNILQAYNKSENVIIWFKDKGIEMLKEMVTSALYKQRKEQMSMTNSGQLTFLFSRIKKNDLLLEPWVGVIKCDNGIVLKNITINGWNCAWQVQSEGGSAQGV